MDIVKYKFTPGEVFEDIADAYNISVGTLAQLNNINNSIPYSVDDNANIKDKGFLYVPLIGNGGNWDTPTYFDKNVNMDNIGYARSSSTLGGSGGNVVLIINGISINIPCYPTSLSDSTQVSYSSQTVPYRTEPYLNYSGSGPRKVSANFELHREMMGDDGSTVDDIIKLVQAACYPTASSGSVAAVETSLIIANQLSITGVLDGSVSVSYSPPIIDGLYNIYSFSISITEVTGNEMIFAQKYGSGARSS